MGCLPNNYLYSIYLYTYTSAPPIPSKSTMYILCPNLFKTIGIEVQSQHWGGNWPF